MTTLFYLNEISGGLARLDEEESRHLAVLRQKAGGRLRATDGKGFFYEVEIVEIGKRQTVLRVVSQIPAPRGAGRLHLAVAPTKNMDRFEWFLEKATEIGVDSIMPIWCERSERTTVRVDRVEKILIAAMKQSMRAYLPQLHAPTPFLSWVKSSVAEVKCLAWCADAPLPHLKSILQPGKDTLIAIGPEGDFSPAEVTAATAAGFTGVSLGDARLRTETAGVYAVACYQLFTGDYTV